jgi:hypothetical protein
LEAVLPTKLPPASMLAALANKETLQVRCNVHDIIGLGLTPNDIIVYMGDQINSNGCDLGGDCHCDDNCESIVLI